MVALAVLVTPPPVAVTVSVRVALVALLVTVAVSVEVPLPPFTGDGLTPTVRPVREPLALRDTGELNPFCGASVTV
jgi:hypothetical protein